MLFWLIPKKILLEIQGLKLDVLTSVKGSREEDARLLATVAAVVFAEVQNRLTSQRMYAKRARDFAFARGQRLHNKLCKSRKECFVLHM